MSAGIRQLFTALWLALPTLSIAAPADIAYLAWASDGYWQAWVMSADGSDQRQVTSSEYDKSRVSWYPDGRHLLVSGNQGELVKVSLANGAETPIPTAMTGMNDAVLSSDGKRIAFSLSTSDSIDDNNIWWINADGGESRKLTNKRFLQHDPAWSQDGEAIYFLSGKGDQTHDLWRYHLGDGDLEQLTSGQLYHFDVAPGPGGALAFSSNRSGNYEIWYQPSGQKPRPLTTHPALDARPSWSPDGTSLVFESTRGGAPNIWYLPLTGDEPVQLTDHPGGARAPVWFAGGKP